MVTCPECKGTGRYVGLNSIEPCRACAQKSEEWKEQTWTVSIDGVDHTGTWHQLVETLRHHQHALPASNPISVGYGPIVLPAPIPLP